MARQELGKWILDVAKYITAAGLIAPFLLKATTMWWYVVLGVIVIFMLVAGLVLVDEKLNKEIKIQ